LADKIICFSHIPKTAGTTINLLLRRYFGYKLIAVEHRARKNQVTYQLDDLKIDLKLHPPCKCITGHTLKPFVNFHDLEKKMFWVTFLRKPEKRFISHYIHQKTSGISKFDLDFIEWGRTYHRSNWMVRMIAGEESLSKAIDILEEKFRFVGLVELFDESMELFTNIFDLDGFNLNYKNKKMVVRNNALKEEIYHNYPKYESYILEQNNLDIELYRYVKDTIWSRQIIEFPLTKNMTKNNNRSIKEQSNLLAFKLYRNMIYKPYLKIEYYIKAKTT